MFRSTQGYLQKVKEEEAALRAQLDKLLSRSVAKERELLETKSKLADLSQEHLVQEEDHKRRLGELASRNKSLVKERKRNNKEKAKLNDENTRLKARSLPSSARLPLLTAASTG